MARFRFSIFKRLRRTKLTPEEKAARDSKIKAEAARLRREVKGIESPLIIDRRITLLRGRLATAKKGRTQSKQSAILTFDARVKTIHRAKAVAATERIDGLESDLKREKRLLLESKKAAPVKRALAAAQPKRKPAIKKRATRRKPQARAGKV